MHSELRDLELRYDGPIPRGLRAAAIAADLEASRATPRSPVRLRVKHWKAAGIIGRMADAIAFHRGRAGECTRQDLAKAGFTTLQIDRYGHDAVALAVQRLPGDVRPIEIHVTTLLAEAAATRNRRVAA